MLEILYQIIIVPLEIMIGILFNIFNNFFGDNVLFSIMFVSFVVTMFCLPLYNRADKLREEEEEKLKVLEPQIQKIKKNFSSDEQFFMLKTLYRQHNYNPIMSIKKSFSLLLQIPFFIAAYHMFSNLESCTLYGHNLLIPDGIILINGFKLNILPVIMTFINIVSCELYLAGKNWKARIQPYALAFVFLIFLYNSPAVLVIYWTFNNFFYLLKNKYMDRNNPANFAYWLTLYVAIIIMIPKIMDVWVYGYTDYHLNLLDMFPLFLALFIIGLKYLSQKNIIHINPLEKSFPSLKIFLLTCLCFIGLVGIIIPIKLISTDISGFFFGYDNIKNLMSILFGNIYLTIGFYLFWNSIIYYFLPKKYRLIYTIFVLSLFLFGLFNYISFGEHIGKLSIKLVFDDSQVNFKLAGTIFDKIVNSLVFLIIFSASIWALKKANYKNFVSLLLIIIFSESIISTLYLFKFNKQINIYNTQIINNSSIQQIQLSKNKKNVIIIFSDRFLGAFLPIILNEKPELKKNFDGFTFYPNTISLYGHTILAYPAMIGGYEYSPIALNKDKRLVPDKFIEASLMLLTLFRNNDYLSTVIEPTSRKNNDFSKYFDYCKSKKINYIINKDSISNQSLLTQQIKTSAIVRFFQFSLLNISPKIFKLLIYNNGNYLFQSTDDINDFLERKRYKKDYNLLQNLNKYTNINSKNKTFTLINTELTHGSIYMQYPNYTWNDNITNIGYNFLNDETSFKCYHTAMATTIAIAKYLKYLKQEGVYDNTRIIIVSDHAESGIHLPNFTQFQNQNITGFNPLLMVKDFSERGELKTSNNFMTNADVPYIATQNLIKDAKNPFTGKPFTTNPKKNGVDVYLNHNYWNFGHFNGSKTILDKTPNIMHVQKNIFDENNWKTIDYNKINVINQSY